MGVVTVDVKRYTCAGGTCKTESCHTLSGPRTADRPDDRCHSEVGWQEVMVKVKWRNGDMGRSLGVKVSISSSWVCVRVCMYVRIPTHTHARLHARMHACMPARTHARSTHD